MPSVEATLLRNTLDIIGAANGTARDMIRVLNIAQERAIARIPSRLTTLSRARERALARDISGVLAGLDGRVERVLGRARAAVIRADYARLANAMAEEAGEPVPSRLPIEQAERILRQPLGGHTLAYWTSRMNHQLEMGIRRELAASRLAGDGIDEIARRLRQTFGLARQSAVTLTRTSMLQAMGDVRSELYDDNADLIDSYSYLATLDARTCMRCAPHDKETAARREDLPEPPLHPNCRCIVRPNITGGERVKRQVKREESRRIVQHRDGTTSTEWRNVRVTQERLTYNQFFRSQPAAWQRQVLGPTRYDLWQTGQVQLGQFARGDHVLTLRQLRRNFGVELN